MEAILTILAVAGGCVLTAAVVALMWLGGLFLSWLGHVVVRILSFGRIDLDWLGGSECFLTVEFGLFFLLFVSGVLAWAVHG